MAGGREGRRRLLLALVVAAATAAAAYALHAQGPSASSASASHRPGVWGSRRRRAMGVLPPPTMLLSRRGGGGDDDGDGSSSSSGGNALDPPAPAPAPAPAAASLQELIEEETRDILSVYGEDEEGDPETPQWSLPEETEEDTGGEESPSQEQQEAAAAAREAAALPIEERTACVVVDPFSPFLGKRLKRKARARGLVVIDVLSPYTVAGLGPGTRRWRAPREGEETAAWAAQLPFKKVAFVLSESDVGTASAERLHVALGSPGSGINPARRNKFLTNLALQGRGAASTRQVLAGAWAEAAAFLARLQAERGPSHDDGAAPLAVVKPARGAASGDVYVCRDVTEAKAAFEAVVGTPKFGGGLNERVLVQEYLRGQEYAVDTVSSGGEHKVVAVWRYDKRAVNGAPAVYFGTCLEAAPEGSEARRVAEYVLGEVLPALGIQWGPTHTEVIVTAGGQWGPRAEVDEAGRTPVIVECNARWHLCNFLPVTEACLGCNAVDATLDAFVDPEAFAALPRVPEKLAAHGRVVHLVCFGTGRVAAHRHVAEIEALDSVKEFEIYASFDVGEHVTPTVDIRTDAGYVLLIHEDAEQVERDYRRIVELMPEILVVDGREARG